jgi:hypothetical protein
MVQESNQKNINIVNGLLTIDAEGYQVYVVKTPPDATQIHVQGSFNASGGTGNDIEVFIMDTVAFKNWQNNHTVRAYYDSGRLTTSNFDVALPSGGEFALVFSNTFSSFSRKIVNAFACLFYQI